MDGSKLEAHHDTSPMEELKSESDSGPQYTKEEERKAVRKLDYTLISLLGIIYIFSYLDRGNIGNAYSTLILTAHFVAC